MNIIFLDMDGVLNSSEVQKKWTEKNGFSEKSRSDFIKKYCLNKTYPFYYIVPELLKRFNKLFLKIPNCKVVWSSSWRLTTKKDSKRFVESLYYQCGFPKNSFLDFTPNIPYLLRYNEIEEWIKTFKDIYKIEKCAIIDDLNEADPGCNFFLGIPIKFFHTSSQSGLTEEIAEEILLYFLKEDEGK